MDEFDPEAEGEMEREVEVTGIPPPPKLVVLPAVVMIVSDKREVAEVAEVGATEGEVGDVATADDWPEEPKVVNRPWPVIVAKELRPPEFEFKHPDMSLRWTVTERKKKTRV